MTLLEDIQNSAVDAKSDLGTLLRKCKLLAARLGSQPLEEWLVSESNGYLENVEVPEYRVWSLQIKGHFSGPFGSGLRNAPIPLSCIRYDRYKCRQSIATIEDILAKTKGGMIQVSTSDLALVLGTKVYEHQNCLQAWAEFGTANLVELLNTVRNRILDFALAIWKEAPMAGESGSNAAQQLGASKVTQIFNTTVYGGSANLVGSAQGSSVSFRILTNDFTSLERVLRENGVGDEDIAELRTAIESDERPSSPERFGPRVSSWIAAMIKKAATGTWEIGVGAAGNLLGQAVSKFYGF
jgi:hypothetical protein